MVSSTVINYVFFYIIFVLVLSLMMTYGLDDYLALSLNIEPPTLYSLPVPSGCSWGIFCILVDWGTAIVNFFGYIVYFFSNIAFFIGLSSLLSSSSLGILGIIFTGMTILFILCMALIVKPVGGS